jgi:hypothetical protein
MAGMFGSGKRRPAMKSHDPTYRETVQNTLADIMRAAGAGNVSASNTGRRINNALADFTPLGALYGGQEAYRQVGNALGQGRYGDAAAGTLGGMLAVLPIPGPARHAAKPFKQWFGKSRIVAPDGKPLTMYHGTKSDIESFDPKTFRTTTVSWARGSTSPITRKRRAGTL